MSANPDVSALDGRGTQHTSMSCNPDGVPYAWRRASRTTTATHVVRSITKIRKNKSMLRWRLRCWQTLF